MDIRKINAILDARKLLAQLEAEKRTEADYNRVRADINQRVASGKISANEGTRLHSQNANNWNEAQHPRDASGRFTSADGGNAGKKPAPKPSTGVSSEGHPGGKEGAQRDADKLGSQWVNNLPASVANKLDGYNSRSGALVLSAQALDATSIGVRIQYYDSSNNKRTQSTMLYWNPKKMRWEA